MKKTISLMITVLLILFSFVCVKAEDSFFSGTYSSYSSSTALTKNEVKNAYRYFTSVIDSRYIKNLYDIMFNAQYRLSLFSGDKWKYYNDGDSVTAIDDNVLGRISIYSAKGCNAYARYAAKYIRGVQGTTFTIDQYLNKESTYIPSADEAKDFIETFADVGERVLICYYNSKGDEIRPHSLLFICEDSDKEGFYYLCQDGDGYGQTLRYMTYSYLCTRLRYYDKYNYCLAVGDTNNGKDFFSNDRIYGEITGISSAGNQASDIIEVYGWAVNNLQKKISVKIYIDDEYYDDALICSSDYAKAVYPYAAGNSGGFKYSFSICKMCSGNHTIKAKAVSESESVILGTKTFKVNNSYFKSEYPIEDNKIYLKSEAVIFVKGWAFDGSGAPTEFFVQIDDGKIKKIETVPREDVFNEYFICSNEMCGYDAEIDCTSLESGSHTIHIFAKGPQEYEEIVSHNFILVNSRFSLFLLNFRKIILSFLSNFFIMEVNND